MGGSRAAGGGTAREQGGTGGRGQAEKWPEQGGGRRPPQQHIGHSICNGDEDRNHHCAKCLLQINRLILTSSLRSTCSYDASISQMRKSRLCEVTSLLQGCVSRK